MLKQLFYSLLILMVGFSACQPEKEKHEDEEKSSKTMKIDDPHSYARPKESVVKHLDWKAKVNFEEKNITAKATLTIENAEDAEKLILDTKDLKIDSITLGDDEQKATYDVGQKTDAMGSPLTIKIKPDTKKVNVYYSTSSDAEALQWLSPVQTAGKDHPFLFTQSQAILARSWVPIQDSPGIRFTYSAEVEVPKGLLALMSAANPQQKNENGIYKFQMDQPIPAYLLALAVGHVEFAEIGPRTAVYAEPSVIDGAKYEFGELEEMVTAAEELYGPYQWGRYDLLVLPPSFPFGGMENPRLTFATPTILAGDRSLTSLVAHELAHSWSGNLVTNATWNDFWLNEGFTVYFEQRIMERLYGRDYSEMLASLAAQDLKAEIEEMRNDNNEMDTRLKLELEGRNPDEGVTSIAYDKGYLFLRYLEEQVGREKFDTFLKDYFSKNAFEVMTTEEFIKQLQINLLDKERVNIGKVKIEEWIYKPGLPEDAPVPQSDKFANVDKQVEKFINGTPASELDTTQWSSHEWLHFVRVLPVELDNNRLTELDKTFGFTQTGNSEVLMAWLLQAIKHNYEPAYSKLEHFLVNTGRRKFLTPLYGELLKTEAGKERAINIYEQARPNYHFVATNTIDEMLNWEEQSKTEN
ncbi:M1 family metallopeptidase [Fulvivirga sp. 29W222]|uniref:Aminopeptidase N n=1 Tax=Fulvivirga marina TaxID=2494733 RepID=A0A937FYT9_9BACT|nr:M1 family metallopeptidase [Fulvivirga marina]MBL6447517.1 M1 family metallopeptidase [Fulvivirga marina]